MKDYPFLETLRAKLDLKNETIDWLAAQIGRTRNWFYGVKSVEKIEIGIIWKISEALDFDILADFQIFMLQQNNIEYYNTLSEPVINYNYEKKISIQLKINAIPSKFKSFPDLLRIIQTEGEKVGFEISEG